jgi:chromosome segregation protein
LAKTEGQLGGLRQRLASLTADLEDRRRVQQETQDQINSAVERERGCQRKILAASSQIAELFLRKERLSREIEALAGRRDDFRGQRQSLSAESQSGRETLQQLQSELHQRQLEASDIRHQRATLVERIREDYELDLANQYQDYQPDPTLDREVIQQEIQELRRKIAGLGNVNLEALAELQDLETRSTTLNAQIADLSQSKATLDEIIRKINQDSQRLFMETLEAIRSHFGELFRKLFGGGRADIVLENEADVLESGIEIVARPPGKELRSLSLLSGGEKTLTTVALLMAVFRSKPSPFCILDEVDAALDEANIERYTTLLREFASAAQFIMITHSKKSMVCADVLYGVTMQESGVSKRVSVRFEDVGEQGEISEAAFQRTESSDPPPSAAPGEQEAA